MVNKLRAGITIPELIGVFALLGVLCAAIVPHLLEFREASRLSMLRFQLEKLRLRIDEYRQRTGQPPEKLGELFNRPTEPVPENLMQVAGPMVVGLTASPERLVQIRRNRLLSLKEESETDYVDMESVKLETVTARRMFAQKGWPVIDVTRRSIEETAAAVMTLLANRNDD